MRTLHFLVRKEFLQIFRDSTIVRMIFIIPLVQLILLANAATFEIHDARLWVVDQDRTPVSRDIVTRMTASGRFVLAGQTATTDAGIRAMLDRETDVILAIPHGFERELIRTKAGQVQVILNAEDGAAAGVIQSYAMKIFTAYGKELDARITPALESVRHSGVGRGVIDVRERGWFNPGLRYTTYMVPGILVVLVTMLGTMLTAMNIVREKEIGTLDQLNVTPITRPVFIAAKLIPMWVIAQIVFFAELAVAHFMFGVPVEGSLLLIWASLAVYLVGALAIGLWISTASQTQQQAMFVTFFVMMIYILMSGLFTSVRSMPEWAQWLTEVNPVMHFTRLMRAVLLKGADLEDVARELGMMGGISVIVLGLAVRQYHKRAE